MSTKIIKSRAYWFIVYPDSTVDNWIDIIKEYHISFIISPLHDKDINADGTQKKPHYHVLLIFPNTTTPTLANDICSAINGVRPPKDRFFACSSISSCARYLIHRDDADKYQYDVNDVYCYGDISYLEAMASNYEVNNTIDLMKLFIEQHRIVSIPLFTAYCREYSPEWSYILNSQHSLKIERHIKSEFFVCKELNVYYDFQIIWSEDMFPFLDKYINNCSININEELYENAIIFKKNI